MEKNSANVLISGGTGLIGSHLSEYLRNNGYDVAYLSRYASNNNNVKIFQWNLKTNFIEPGAIEWADYIIHLAGAGIADKRWTEKRKKIIRDSRVKSAELIVNKLKETNHHVKAIISSSAVGYYGDTGDEWVDENSPPGNDFMGKTAFEWEKSIKKAEELNIRICILRTGVVLTKKGGALPKLAMPVKFLVGAPLGSGRQYLSWVHINDLSRIYVKAIKNENMKGIFNAVAPNPVTNKEFTKVLANVLRRPLFLPPVPAFALKWFLGEMAEPVLMSSRVSNQKLIDSGFVFEFNGLKSALEDIYK